MLRQFITPDGITSNLAWKKGYRRRCHRFYQKYGGKNSNLLDNVIPNIVSFYRINYPGTCLRVLKMKKGESLETSVEYLYIFDSWNIGMVVFMLDTSNLNLYYVLSFKKSLTL